LHRSQKAPKYFWALKIVVATSYILILGLKVGSIILIVADFSLFYSTFSSIFSIYGSIYPITGSILIGGFIVIGTDSIGSRIEGDLMT
jgi:hypothetical protein